MAVSEDRSDACAVCGQENCVTGHQDLCVSEIAELKQSIAERFAAGQLVQFKMFGDDYSANLDRVDDLGVLTIRDERLIGCGCLSIHHWLIGKIKQVVVRSEAQARRTMEPWYSLSVQVTVFLFNTDKSSVQSLFYVHFEGTVSDLQSEFTRILKTGRLQEYDDCPQMLCLLAPDGKEIRQLRVMADKLHKAISAG